MTKHASARCCLPVSPERKCTSGHVWLKNGHYWTTRDHPDGITTFGHTWDDATLHLSESGHSRKHVMIFVAAPMIEGRNIQKNKMTRSIHVISARPLCSWGSWCTSEPGRVRCNLLLVLREKRDGTNPQPFKRTAIKLWLTGASRMPLRQERS